MAGDKEPNPYEAPKGLEPEPKPPAAPPKKFSRRKFLGTILGGAAGESFQVHRELTRKPKDPENTDALSITGRLAYALTAGAWLGGTAATVIDQDKEQTDKDIGRAK